ncbi:hypothetical protein CVD28_02560 [Bacillus sp. M6-12]|nr:hypothetical protein CVD28_02560 [Bacillus sp. M6-12]
MGLLDNKSWMAQDLYNEYLDLKTEIPQLINSRDHFFRHQKMKEVKEFQESIDEKVKRFKTILNELKVVHGIAMEDLILLSIGIDV